MRDNPIHTFFQVLGGNIPDQLNLGGFRWFEVVFYWVTSDRKPHHRLHELAPGFDPAHRDASQHLRHAAGQCRHVVSRHPMEAAAADIGGLQILVGEHGQIQLIPDAHASIMQVFLDHIALVQPLVYLLETALAVSLMLGIAVRLAGIVGVLFILNLLIGLYNDPTEWPWTYVGIICAHGMFAVAQAGRSLGIDNLLAKRLIPGLPYDGVLARAIAVAS